MPGALPDGSGFEPVPADGALPDGARRALGERPFGVYVHVPFCTTRCGYCDFNTYTAAELGGSAGSAAVSLAGYPTLAIAEIGFARKVLGSADIPVSTVFFGGGTPTLMPPAAFGAILRAIDGEFGLAPGAEVSTEANPESVEPRTLAELRAQGITRVSFGMQSAVPGVLAVLDRVHQPGRPARCAAWARAAGFSHVSLDLIYGTPGETDADWRCSLEAAIGAGPDHVSAYALTVETGTRLAARVRRGELAAPDDDVLADRYLAADELLSAAGYGWYEISNWAAGAASRCAHNLLYWTGGDWWGAARARTATSAAPAGGTSGIPPPTPRGSARGSARARPARCWPSPNVSWSASCCSCAWPKAARWPCSARPGGPARPRWSPRGWPACRPTAGAGSCSPAGAGCSPTPLRGCSPTEVT